MSLALWVLVLGVLCVSSLSSDSLWSAWQSSLESQGLIFPFPVLTIFLFFEFSLSNWGTEPGALQLSYTPSPLYCLLSC